MALKKTSSPPVKGLMKKDRSALHGAAWALLEAAYIVTSRYEKLTERWFDTYSVENELDDAVEAAVAAFLDEMDNLVKAARSRRNAEHEARRVAKAKAKRVRS